MHRIRILMTIGLASLAVGTTAIAQGPFNAPDIVGTDQGETLRGGINSERIFALGGNDIAQGNPGSDWVDGGQGRDTLSGGSGNDLLTGETCNNERCDAPESDVLRGGSGNDTLEGNQCRANTYPEECPDGRANDRLYGENGNDELHLHAPGTTLADGGNGSDGIHGSDGSDVIVGGTGNDTITAFAGNDRINVRDGERDTVNCGAGRDTVRADRRDRLRGCESVTPKRRR